jgi:hypothetical protein
MLNFCTLFDSFYLDKGIALANSLNRYSKGFKLYIYAFDKRAYDILKDMNIMNVEVILFENIISEQLKKIREKRTRSEFCWTCTSYIIEYTFEHYKVDMCTYIDADLYFYDNPQVLIDEMLNSNCSIQIVEHRFPDNKKYREISLGSGRFCVEFNTFCNDEIGRKVLEEWKNQCFECCTSDWNTGSFGDQKYLEEWENKYKKVNVLSNHGGGMAPWNIGRYRRENTGKQGIWFKDRKTKEIYRLVFYHFHDLHFINNNTVNINIYDRHRNIDGNLCKDIYIKYLSELRDIRIELHNKYGLVLNDTWKKENDLLWNKKCKYSVVYKIKRIIKLPVSLYEIYFREKKDIIKLD